MYNNPVSLLDACVEAFAKNVWTTCNGGAAEETKSGDISDSIQSIRRKRRSVFDENWNDSQVRLPVLVSDQLLQAMDEGGYLNDQTLGLFSAERTSLQHISICRSPGLTKRSLKIFSEHCLQTVTLRHLPRVDLDVVLTQCLNASTLRTLTSLDARGMVRRVSDIKAAIRFQSLRALNVSKSVFDDSFLELICNSLPHLEFLDISRTKVHDLQPLCRLKNTLRALICHMLKSRRVAYDVNVLLALPHLEVLDISDSCGKQSSHSHCLIATLIHDAAALERPVWTEMRALDLSGCQYNLNAKDLKTVLHMHPSIEFIGLLMTNGCFFEYFRNERHLQISGDATKEQLFVALKSYTSMRESFCARTLHVLFGALQRQDFVLDAEEKTFCLQQIVTALKRNALTVQIAGIACLYVLCQGDRANGIAPFLLSRIIDACLRSVQKYPRELQLHKNVWMTLCNNYILQSATFDMYMCCVRAFESMMTNHDSAITRMTVAIVSVLAAKIPTSQTTSLGTNPSYMKYLLHLLNEKLKQHNQNQIQNPHVANQADITLKLTLNAIWNLTDESPETCKRFIDEGGLDAIVGILQKFHDCSIETKALGLLNNVAEVLTLKQKLLTLDCLNVIIASLGSAQIDVSYFAAGILSHLCVDLEWNYEPSRATCLQLLEQVVTKWGSPQIEMVSYRSFKPFFSLFKNDDALAVQLWATWGILHVCSKNAPRYVSMFKEEGGEEVMERILRSNGARHPILYRMCTEVLDLLNQ